MPAPIVTTQSTMQCAHGGAVQALTSEPRVMVAGAPVLSAASALAVSGCPLVPPPQPPDVTAQFALALSTRVQVGGKPLVLANSVALATPTGTPISILSTQSRVTAT